MANLYIPAYRGKLRSELPEIMDDLQLDDRQLVLALDTIGRINRQLGGSHVVLSALRYTDRNDITLLKICDMGCGGGDIARDMARYLKKSSVRYRITAIDANAAVIRYAREHSDHHPEIIFRKASIFDRDFTSENFDVITSSLFLHHFPDEKIVEILQIWQQQAHHCIIINDLQRNRLAFHLFKLYTFVIGAPWMARYDGAVSILRGFTRRELRDILSRAGISQYTLRRKWAFRWQLIINTR